MKHWTVTLVAIAGCCLAPLSPARAAEWQWSVTMERGRAFLWIPPDCKQVRAVVVGQNNMIEQGLLEHPVLRATLAKLGIAEVFIAPIFDTRFQFDKGAGEIFADMMKRLGDTSGYSELDFAPIAPLGHSACAWHGGQASNWSGTPMAKLLRPWQDLVRQKLKDSEGTLPPQVVEKVWFHLTNSYNSDGQWPPTTKASPHIIYPFNYNYNFENLLAAELLLGGVDRTAIDADPLRTMREIFTMQQDLVLEKADELLKSGSAQQKAEAKLAQELIKRSRDTSSVPPGTKVLYPSEYESRANMLIAARQLVGGVVVAGDK